MLPYVALEQLAAALDAVAEEVLDQAAAVSPPIDAFRLARALGITVALDACQRGRARYVRLRGYGVERSRATILLRPEPRQERKHWAVAHEIGEHVAHRVFGLLGTDPRETGPRAREQVANQLAGRLLLPTGWFVDHGRECGWDLIALKARYTTASHELIARRMLECPPPVIISIFDHGAVYFRRANLPGQVPRPSPSEMQCWRTVHRSGLPAECDRGPGVIRGWPVHEDGWRREILRTEVDEAFPDAVWPGAGPAE